MRKLEKWQNKLREKQKFLYSDNVITKMKSFWRQVSLKWYQQIESLINKIPHYFYYLYLEFDAIAAFNQFFHAEKLFSKYDDVIVTSRLFVQVW